MRYANQVTIIIIAIVSLAIAQGSAASSTRSGVVKEDGRIVTFANEKSAKLDCTDNDNDLFAFEESAIPDSLSLDENSVETGAIEITVEITDACGTGQATFEYGHDSLGSDLSASPESLSLSVAIPGGVSSGTINYQPIDDTQTEDEETFALQGERVLFNVDGVFGESSSIRQLATIVIPANTDQVADVGNLPEGAADRERDAIRALNNACRSERQSDDAQQEFVDRCDAIAALDLDSSQTQQLGRAVDPHELSSQPEGAVEVGKMQNSNLQQRLAALRGGATGVSLSGLSIAMNGRVFQGGWIQEALNAGPEEDSSRSTRLLGQKWGVFVNGSITVGERDERNKELGFDFDAYGLTAGADYRFDNGLVLGGALGLTRNESELDQDGGTLEADALSWQGFGTYNFTENLYLDFTLAYTRSDFDQNRVVDLSSLRGFSRGVARGSTDGEQVSASLALNYIKRFQNGVTTNFYSQALSADTEIDPFTERGSEFPLSYPGQEFESLFWSAGARISKAYNLENIVFNPFVDLSFGRETTFDGYFFLPTFAEADQPGPLIEISEPDREHGKLSIGASWVHRSGNQFFVRVNSLFAHSDTDRYNVVVGGRMEF